MAARRYVRDNRGRFAAAGAGATARGGRLRTAAGNKRATQTEKLAGGKPGGTIGKPRGLKPGAIKPKAAAPSRSGRGKAPQSRVPSAASDSFKYNKSGQIASPAERAKMRGRERHHEKQMLLAEKRRAGVLRAERKAARDVERGRITPVENSYAASNAKRAHDRRAKRAGQNFGAGGVELMRRESALTQKAKRIEAKAAERKAAGKAVTPRMQAEHAELRRQILKTQKSQATRKKALSAYEGTKNRIEANIRSRSRYSY